MFLKQLIICNQSSILRDIVFHKGINLIVDETPLYNTPQTTGNNVGKTTVLRLIDFCLGGDGKNIYQDIEFKKQPNTIIKKFLIDNNIIITLILTSDLDNNDGEEIVIRKNFLTYKHKIQEINNVAVTDKDFDEQLKNLIFKTEVEKPTFRQIISKNIRDEKNRMSNIVKVLNPYTKAEEYEALYLFWLGLSFDSMGEKQRLSEEIKSESALQKRLSKENNLSFITQALVLIQHKIEELNNKKNSFNINENYSVDVDSLNNIKSTLNRKSSELSVIEIRRDLINESIVALEQEHTNINVSQIQALYERAKVLIPNIQVSFEETIQFHNDLISQKLKYISKELPEIEQSIKLIKANIISLRSEENALIIKLQNSGVLEELGEIISQLNTQFERKGNLEELKKLWEHSIENVHRITTKLTIIDDEINSKDQLIQSRITEFNKYFVNVSNKLYGEEYVLSSQQTIKGIDLSITNIEGNPSTRKKKGQIAAFDFAYIQFADSMGIECLHFILHDQLETIDDNQQKALIEIANSINGQYIVPLLRDKVSSDIDIALYEILTLSQDNKLFKI